MFSILKEIKLRLDNYNSKNKFKLLFNGYIKFYGTINV
jgi:hypothetical protein